MRPSIAKSTWLFGLFGALKLPYSCAHARSDMP